MNVLSLFDGMSNGQIALNRINVNINKYMASEIDNYAIKVTMKNYPNTIQLGNIIDLHWDETKDKIDLLIGGSPCQGFSRAGKGLNFNDPRSKLFFEYKRLLDESNPKYFLYENTPMKQESQDIMSELLGVKPILINSSLVSAQNRERLYWTNIPGVTQPEDKGIALKDIILDDEYTIGAAMRGRYISTNKTKQFIELRKDEKMNAITTVEKNTILVHKCHRVGTTTEINGYDIVKRVYSIEGKAPTLTTMGGGHREPKIAVDEIQWRKLLPIEMERLQTVPDNYTDYVSSTQRKKMLGNGWTVDVIAHILKHIPKEGINND
jgi:DNA-cytosine methyltransferase